LSTTASRSRVVFFVPVRGRSRTGDSSASVAHRALVLSRRATCIGGKTSETPGQAFGRVYDKAVIGHVPIGNGGRGTSGCGVVELQICCVAVGSGSTIGLRQACA